MGHKPRVLIVEDNARNRKLFRLVVDNMGCESLLASDGEEGLRQLEGALPDLILMDIQLPGIDGLTLLQQLREQPRTRTVPVVAVTSFAMPGDRERLLGAGFTDYLSKPIDTEELQAVIARLLPPGHGRDA
jgi:two-component system cell cycle response regulator/two-component system cell cycle response regulator DivK